MDASGEKWQYIVLLVIIALCQRKCYSYDLRCPERSEWKFKGNATCGIVLEYFCVLDDNVRKYTEFCKRNPDITRDITWKKGQKSVLRGNLDGEVCSTERYQPFIFRTDGNSDCAYKKSFCQGEGIIVYKNGSTTSDMQCRCDYTKGFAFVSKTKQSCFCIPSQEDCSCYKKKCKSNYKLSSDYSCLSIYSPAGQSACFDQNTRLLTNSDSQMDKLKQFNTNVSAESGMNQSPIMMMVLKRHAAITVTVLTGVIIVIFFIVMMGCFRNVGQNEMLDELNEKISPTITDSLPDSIEKQVDYNEKIPLKIREAYNKCISNWTKEDTNFYVTRSTIKIGEILSAKNCVLVVGRSGNGKTATIRNIALKLCNEEGYDIVPIVLDPRTILDYANPNRKQIFVIDNLCGIGVIDAQNVEMWSLHIDEILKLIVNNPEHADRTSGNGTIKLLFATASCVFEDNLFKNIIRLSNYKIHLSEWPLQKKEKIEMIKKYLKEDSMSNKFTKNLKSHEDVFPLLCKLSEGKAAKHIIQFFQNPDEVIKEHFQKLKETNKTQICLIALCVLLESLKEDIFRNDNTPEHDKSIIEAVCDGFGIKDTSWTTLEKELENLDETYFVKLGDAHHFVHKKIYNIAAVFCGSMDKIMNIFIKVAPSCFIAEWYYFTEDGKKIPDLICIPNVFILNIYFDRLMCDLKQGITYSTFHNRQLKNETYRNKFCAYCREINVKVIASLNQFKKCTTHEITNCKTKATSEKNINRYTDYIEFTKSCHFSTHNMKIPLIESAWEGYDDIVEMLIDMKCDVNEIDIFKRSALFVACRRGKEKVALLLLRNDAKHSLCDVNETSPLLAACKSGFIYPKLIEKLLELGADASKGDDDKCYPLHAASVANHKNIVEELLKEKNKVNIYEEDKSGRSAIFLASNYGRKAVVEILLKNKASLNQCDKKGFTPLIAACTDGKLNVVTDLLKRNVEISMTDKRGRSALFIACKKGEARIVDVLLEKNANVSQCDNQGCSPLYIACSLGHEQIVCLLVKFKAEVSQCNKDGKSPFFIACEKGFDTIFDILIDKCSVEDLEKVDNQERTPLYVASKGGFIRIVKKLVSNGAKVNKSNKWQMTPLLVASREGHSRVVKYLIKENADLEDAEFNGRTPLSVACDDGNADVVRILIKNNSNVKHTDNENKTPIELAIRSGHKDIVDFLNTTGKSKKQP